MSTKRCVVLDAPRALRAPGEVGRGGERSARGVASLGAPRRPGERPRDASPDHSPFSHASKAIGKVPSAQASRKEWAGEGTSRVETAAPTLVLCRPAPDGVPAACGRPAVQEGRARVLRGEDGGGHAPCLARRGENLHLPLRRHRRRRQRQHSRRRGRALPPPLGPHRGPAPRGTGDVESRAGVESGARPDLRARRGSDATVAGARARRAPRGLFGGAGTPAQRAPRPPSRGFGKRVER